MRDCPVYYVIYKYFDQAGGNIDPYKPGSAAEIGAVNRLKNSEGGDFSSNNLQKAKDRFLERFPYRDIHKAIYVKRIKQKIRPNGFWRSKGEYSIELYKEVNSSFITDQNLSKEVGPEDLGILILFRPVSESYGVNNVSDVLGDAEVIQKEKEYKEGEKNLGIEETLQEDYDRERRANAGGKKRKRTYRKKISKKRKTTRRR